jgi:hypothetical protein
MASLPKACGSFLTSNEGMLGAAHNIDSPNNDILFGPLQAIQTGRYVDLENRQPGVTVADTGRIHAYIHCHHRAIVVHHRVR